MLVITLQIGLLLAAIILPLKTRKNKTTIPYKVDTDTSNALYAVNEYGTLEKINRIKLNDRSLL